MSWTLDIIADIAAALEVALADIDGDDLSHVPTFGDVTA